MPLVTVGERSQTPYPGRSRNPVGATRAAITQGVRERVCKLPWRTTPPPPPAVFPGRRDRLPERELSAMCCSALEVEPLGRALFLFEHDVVACLLELGVGHLHAPLAQRQEAGLSAHRLDVGARELVLRHDELLEVDVIGEIHLRRVDLEDVPAGLLVGSGELDLAVDARRADERWVEGLDLVRREDDL